MSLLGDIVTASYCGAYPKRHDDIRLPAILFEMVALEPDIAPGTERLALINHEEAHVVLSREQTEMALWVLVQRHDSEALEIPLADCM